MSAAHHTELGRRLALAQQIIGHNLDRDPASHLTDKSQQELRHAAQEIASIAELTDSYLVQDTAILAIATYGLAGDHQQAACTDDTFRVLAKPLQPAEATVLAFAMPQHAWAIQEALPEENPYRIALQHAQLGEHQQARTKLREPAFYQLPAWEQYLVGIARHSVKYFPTVH